MLKLVIIFLIILSGCIAGKSTIAETAKSTVTTIQIQQDLLFNNQELGSLISISEKQILKYRHLKLRLLTVEDSRCAIGVYCIWAGQLIVTLEVSNKNGDKMEVKLIRKRKPEMTNAFGFSWLLMDVKPYPKKGKVIHASEQVIELKIVKTDVN